MTDTKSGARKFYCMPADPNNPKDTGFCVHESARGAIKDKGLVVLTVEFGAYQKALVEIERLNKLLEKAGVKIERQHDALIATKELLDENARLKALLMECLDKFNEWQGRPSLSKRPITKANFKLVREKLQKELERGS